MIVAGAAVKFGSWCGDHLRRRQNRYILLKVAGRDCLLSPILALRIKALIVCAVQLEQYKYLLFEMIAD